MSMLDGVIQCWPLSRSCGADWDGWIALFAAVGVVVAVFGAVGAWLAAAATFYAVYVPYRAQLRLRDEDAMEARIEGENRLIKLVPRLIDIYEMLPKRLTDFGAQGDAISSAELEQWIVKVSKTAFPELPRHADLYGVRRSLAALEVSTSNLDDYSNMGRWGSVAKQHFYDALINVEDAMRSLIHHMDAFMPDIRLHEEFSRYFASRTE
ncbi:hypothetical protein [Stenotrophomonas sp.]|uniref:hypothetical protein n=1 Tax=Stenotrophomonas sp. TaxID=69392 RepID=UPI0033422F8D